MAMLTAQRKSRRFGMRERARPIAEINVTPMVDVMLVLLVIFMVTAPLLTLGVDVNLPKTKAGLLQGEKDQLTVSVDSDGRIFLQKQEIPLENLAPRLIAVTGANPEARIYVRGDKGIAYGRVMQVMGTINAAGFNRVGLVTDKQDAVGKAIVPKTNGGSKEEAEAKQ